MNDYFCVLPFYGAEYGLRGFSTPCCLLPNNHNIQQIRSDMLAGKRTTACKKCWDLEDSRLISDRQLKNSAYDFYADKDIRLVEESCKNGDFNQQIIKLYTSNLCNSTCVTCSPHLSTAWATLSQVKTHISIDNNTIFNLPFKDIVMLNFVGGEPFYEKKNFKILEQLIEVDNTKCFISMTTNGSVDLTNEQIDILSKFKNLNFCVSIDGIGPRFEYLRYPLKWNTLLDNLKLYKQLNVDISISYTISNLNVLYHDETIAWFNEQQLSFNHNVVDNPAYFHPAVLPQKIKGTYPLLMELFEDDREHLLEQLRDEIALQDRLKKINIKDYLPEFYNLVIN